MIKQSPSQDTSADREAPPPSSLSPTCSSDELFTWVKRHYFFREELAEARRILGEKGYEDAIAYLISRGQDTLRDSGEASPPHLYITIPGGRIIVFRPGRPAGSFDCVFEWNIAAFVRLVFPPQTGALPTPPAGPAALAPGKMASLWDEHEITVPPHLEGSVRPQAPEVAKKTSTRPKKLRYDEQPVQVGLKGSGKYCHNATGWVARDRGLAYVIEPRSRGGHVVSLVHLGSHWVLASFLIVQVDELAHLRLRQLMDEVVALADWTQGIKAVLQEKKGDQKQYQWEKQILGIWQQQERGALFALSEESFLPDACEGTPMTVQQERTQKHVTSTTACS